MKPSTSDDRRDDVRGSDKRHAAHSRIMRNRCKKTLEIETGRRLSLRHVAARVLMMGKGVIHHDPVLIEFHLQFLCA